MENDEPVTVTLEDVFDRLLARNAELTARVERVEQLVVMLRDALALLGSVVIEHQTVIENDHKGEVPPLPSGLIN